MRFSSPPLNSIKPFISTLILLGLSSLFAACGGEVAAEKGKSKKRKAKTNTEHPTDAKSKGHGGDGPEKSESPEALWDDLVAGNKLFVSGKYSPEDFLGKRAELSKSQHPKVIVLGCSDSRVPPELVFGKNTGDLFVIRDAGNIVDAVVLGSMEYAVEHLHSSLIVVLGHESCGAVAATLKGDKMPSPNLQAIVDTIGPALKGSDGCSAKGKMNNTCVELNLKQTASQLLQKSKILKDEAAKGKIKIIPALFHLETGEVTKVE